MSQAKTPLPAGVAWLGYGGLVPFGMLALGAWLDSHHIEIWQQALVSYGAVILSFVGALHWGFAVLGEKALPESSDGMYLWSVVPALLGWVALLICQLGVGYLEVGSVLLAGGFVAHFSQDYRIARQLPLPSWYLPLRLRLTAAACLSLIISAAR
jgi:hypothetical protein